MQHKLERRLAKKHAYLVGMLSRKAESFATFAPKSQTTKKTKDMKPQPKTPVWLIRACYFCLSAVGLIAGLFLALFGPTPPDSATVRLLIWCAVEVASCVAAGILLGNHRKKWYTVALCVLAPLAAARVLVPVILLFTSL